MKKKIILPKKKTATSSMINPNSRLVVVGFDLDYTIRCNSACEEDIPTIKNCGLFIDNPKEQRIIKGAKEKTVEFCQYLQDCREVTIATVFAATNQRGVQKRHKTLEDCIKEQKITLDLFPRLDYILFCPDDGQTCWRVTRTTVSNVTNEHLSGSYRKPRAGMLQEASSSLELNSDLCFFVGDRKSDQKAAQSLGWNFLWANDFLKGDFVS